jgi:phage terminase large subunit-like protein
MSTNSLSRNLARLRDDPVSFICEILVNPETGKPFKLYAEQVVFLRLALTAKDGRLPYSELVYSAPKKSGKTGFAAMIVIYTAVALAGANGEIYLLANDFEQSQSRVFKAVVEILRATPLLRDSVNITASKITFKSTGTIIQAVANDFAGFSGANPTLNVYDELAYYTLEPSRRLYDEGIPSPTRAISLRLSVSTAGFDEPSPLRDLYDRAIKHGEQVAPDLRRDGNLLCYWTHHCRAPWQSEAWVAEMRSTLRPAQFKRLIQNEFTSTESAFVTADEWDACVDPELRPVLGDPQLSVFVGLDGSVRHDTTAMVAVTYEYETKRVRVVTHKLFRPGGQVGASQEIDFAAVEAALINWNRCYQVRAVHFDPHQLQAMAQRMRAAGLNMVEINQTPQNLTAAASGLLELIQGRNLVSYSSEELKRAVLNAAVVESSRGFRLAKERPGAKIDLTAALSFACLAAVRQGTDGFEGLRQFHRWQMANSGAPWRHTCTKCQRPHS